MFNNINLAHLIESYVIPLGKMLAILIIGWILSSVASKIIRRILEKLQADGSLINFLAKAASITVKVITIISALGVLGIPTTGLVAGASAVAAAIAIALKDSLANVAGGIFLLVTKPFVTNDVIAVGGDTGKIKEIKLVHTVILTFDNKEIIIPNSILMGSTVTNLSNEDKRRVDIVFSIGYNDDAKLAREIILKALTDHELTLTDEIEPFARVTAHSASSVDITGRAWALAGDYWTVYFDILEEVREEFTKNGISTPYNQLDVHIDGKVQGI